MGACSGSIQSSSQCLQAAKSQCECQPPGLGTLLTYSSDKEAGQALEKKAHIELTKLNEPDDAANTNAEAFKVYRQTDPEDAARVIELAINHYTSKGNFRRAATNKQMVAEVYEVEIGDLKRAVEAYELAAGWFESDNAAA